MYQENKNDLLAQKYDGLPNKNASFLYHLDNAIKPTLQEGLNLHVGTVEYHKGFIMAFNFIENAELYQIHKNVVAVKEALKASNVNVGKKKEIEIEELVGTSIFAYGPTTIMMAKSHICCWEIQDAKQDAQTMISIMKQDFPAAVRRQILSPSARSSLQIIK